MVLLVGKTYTRTIMENGELGGCKPFHHLVFRSLHKSLSIGSREARNTSVLVVRIEIYVLWACVLDPLLYRRDLSPELEALGLYSDDKLMA